MYDIGRDRDLHRLRAAIGELHDLPGRDDDLQGRGVGRMRGPQQRAEARPLDHGHPRRRRGHPDRVRGRSLRPVREPFGWWHRRRRGGLGLQRGGRHAGRARRGRRVHDHRCGAHAEPQPDVRGRSRLRGSRDQAADAERRGHGAVAHRDDADDGRLHGQLHPVELLHRHRERRVVGRQARPRRDLRRRGDARERRRGPDQRVCLRLRVLGGRAPERHHERPRHEPGHAGGRRAVRRQRHDARQHPVALSVREHGVPAIRGRADRAVGQPGRRGVGRRGDHPVPRDGHAHLHRQRDPPGVDAAPGGDLAARLGVPRSDRGRPGRAHLDPAPRRRRAAQSRHRDHPLRDGALARQHLLHRVQRPGVDGDDQEREALRHHAGAGGPGQLRLQSRATRSPRTARRSSPRTGATTTRASPPSTPTGR